MSRTLRYEVHFRGPSTGGNWIHQDWFEDQAEAEQNVLEHQEAGYEAKVVTLDASLPLSNPTPFTGRAFGRIIGSLAAILAVASLAAPALAEDNARGTGTHKATCQQVTEESDYFLALWGAVRTHADALDLAAWSYLSSDSMYWALRDGETTWMQARSIMLTRLEAHKGSCVETIVRREATDREVSRAANSKGAK